MKFKFIRDEKVKAWAKKFGYSFYVNIFRKLAVQRIVNNEFESCKFDNSISQDEISTLILKSVEEDKDLIAPYVQKNTIPDGAII